MLNRGYTVAVAPGGVVWGAGNGREIKYGEGGWSVTPGAFRYSVWLPLLCRSGVRCRKPHALRHTFALGLIQAGEVLAYVKGQLGHHSIKITVDVYGHLAPGTNEAVVDRLDDATGHNPRATDIRSGLRVVQGGQR
jgi:integrase